MTEIIAVVVGAFIGFGFSLILIVAERNASLRREIALEYAAWAGLARSCPYLRDDVESDALSQKLQAACDRICILGRGIIDATDITARTYEITALLFEWRLHLAKDVVATGKYKSGEMSKEQYHEYWENGKRIEVMNKLYNTAQLSADHVATVGSDIRTSDWLSRIADPSL